MNDEGFFRRLFDLSYSRFIATRLIKFAYLIAMIAGIVAVVLAVVGALTKGEPGAAVVALIASPVAFFIYLIVVRLWCEFFIVVFAMAEDLDDIRRGTERLAGDAAKPPPP